MMPTKRDEELFALRKRAEEVAKNLRSRLSTGHYLVAIAERPGPAGDLLLQRRLDPEVLTKAARVTTDDDPDALTRALGKAREIANRSPRGDVGAEHLLFALCLDTKASAHKSMVQCGVDVAKLRASALHLAHGLSPAPRHAAPPSASKQATPKPTTTPIARASSPAPTPPSTPKARPTMPSAPPTMPSADKTQRTFGSKPAHKGKRERQVKAPEDTAFAGLELPVKWFPLLSQISENLTLKAARGELDPVKGRDEEVERVLDVLAKRHANNPCLVGVPAVGKTSIALAVARRTFETASALGAGSDESGTPLDARLVLRLDPGALVANTGMRGQLAERIGQLRAEAKRAEGKVVIFVDGLSSIFGADAGEEASAEWKAALASGDLRLLAAAQTDEYRRLVESDPELARRFTAIEVEELGREDAFLALASVAPLLTAHHHATFSEEVLAATVQCTTRYVPGRPLPDKAIGVLDLAGARARRRGLTDVTFELVADVVSEMTGVPAERLLETDGERMLHLESLLGERVVGHKEELARIGAVLRRNASGFRSERPIGTFLLLGPTGVGKTETAKAIAECLFFSETAMTRLDFSEFAEAHSLARLIGAPPGYVGHESGGQLTEAVRKRPYQVILLDEIEKAHRDVLEGFLQVFDDGRLTDGRGRTVDFSNTVILLTSNLGAEVAIPKRGRSRIGFGARGNDELAERAAYRDAMIASARESLPPELYNRLDEVLAFAPLTQIDVGAVARRMLARLGETLMLTRGVTLDVADEAIEALLAQGGYDPELGARPMRRTIGRLIEAPLAEMILRGEIGRGDVAIVGTEGGAIVVDAVQPKRASA